MPTHQTRDGRRVTVADPTAPHQIRVVRPHGARGRQIAVTCTCGAPALVTVDGVADQWVWFNRLTHDAARGVFVPVDPVTGRPVGVTVSPVEATP